MNFIRVKYQEAAKIKGLEKKVSSKKVEKIKHGGFSFFSMLSLIKTIYTISNDLILLSVAVENENLNVQ